MRAVVQEEAMKTAFILCLLDRQIGWVREGGFCKALRPRWGWGAGEGPPPPQPPDPQPLPSPWRAKFNPKPQALVSVGRREEKALGEAGLEKSTTDGCRFYVLTTVGVNGNTWVGLCELKHL